MNRIFLLTLVASLLCGLPIRALRADTIYYETSTGKDYATKKWQSMDRHKFEARQPDNVYDLYTFQRNGDGTSIVERTVYSIAGDWALLLKYRYAKTARLESIDMDFSTFTGVEAGTGDIAPTRCLRTYSVTQSGNLHLVSEHIEDLKTKRAVKRGFHEPHIDHWMTLDTLPIKPKA